MVDRTTQEGVFSALFSESGQQAKVGTVAAWPVPRPLRVVSLASRRSHVLVCPAVIVTICTGWHSFRERGLL